MPFIKNLASSERKVRTQALETLKAFLSAKYSGSSAATTITFRDAHKLWTGLFYALWMADKPRIQQRLCDELAGLPAAVGLPDASRAVWLQAFWATMARQWTTGIDVLRMDKFLLLVRRVLAAQLAWMEGVEEGAKEEKKGKKGKDSKKGKTEKKAEALGLAVLEEWPLNPEAEAEAPVEEGDDEEEDEEADDYERPRKRVRATVHIPVGLAVHVLDIWVDEVERLGLVGETDAGEDQDQDQDSLVHKVNRLVKNVAANTRAPAVRKRAHEALDDERLPWNRASGEEEKDDEEAEKGSWDGFD